ncbi:MAG: two-component sensor histidine kinase [Ruminococcus sp.]|nr:two-component sensor histidine kinase [Ruminococcus sp.]
MAVICIAVLLLFFGLFGMITAVAWILRKGSNNRLTRLFGLCQISIILWIISQLLILFSVVIWQKKISYIIGNIGISFFAPSWLMFSAEYVEISVKIKKLMRILFIVPVSAVIFVSTNSLHNFYYSEFTMEKINYAPLFYFYQIVYYFCIISGIILICIKQAKQCRYTEKQAFLLSISTAVPLAMNTLTVTKIINLEIELTPLFFAFSSIMILIALGRYGLLDIKNIAMRDVVENIKSGVVILDINGNISYINSYAENIIKIGESADISEIYSGENFFEKEYNGRFLDFKKSFCENNSGTKFAEIITINDVTDYHELADTEKKLGIEQERNRIAQEIHDSAGHTFTLISSISKIISAEISGKTPDKKIILEYISEIDSLSRGGLTQIRCSVNNLREDEFMTSVTKAVKTVADAVRNVDVDLCVQGDDDGKFDFCIREVYNNCREIITNSMRYSEATRIDIILRFLAECLEIYIFDNGRGSDVISEKNGLGGIRERTEKLGGNVKFSSVSGEGFSVIMKIPAERK